MIDYGDRHELSFSCAAMIFACIASFYVVAQFMIMLTVGACVWLKRRWKSEVTRESEVEDGVSMEARKSAEHVARTG